MNLKRFHIAGAIFTLIIGTLLHFTYEWSCNNSFVGIISAVNESTWEHLKLLFMPFLFWGIFEYFVYGHEYPGFVPSKVFSALLGMFFIIAAFYTYTGIVGTNFLIADISIFILGVLISYWFSYRSLSSNSFTSDSMIRIGWLLLIVLIATFIVFTLVPPNAGLFQSGQ